MGSRENGKFSKRDEMRGEVCCAVLCCLYWKVPSFHEFQFTMHPVRSRLSAFSDVPLTHQLFLNLL